MFFEGNSMKKEELIIFTVIPILSTPIPKSATLIYSKKIPAPFL